MSFAAHASGTFGTPCAMTMSPNRSRSAASITAGRISSGGIVARAGAAAPPTDACEARPSASATSGGGRRTAGRGSPTTNATAADARPPVSFARVAAVRHQVCASAATRSGQMRREYPSPGRVKRARESNCERSPEGRAAATASHRDTLQSRGAARGVRKAAKQSNLTDRIALAHVPECRWHEYEQSNLRALKHSLRAA